MVSASLSRGVLPYAEGGVELFSLLPLALALPGVLLVLYLARVLLDRMERHRGSRSLLSYGVLASLGLGGLFVVILTLPDDRDQTQLLTIVGLLFSAAVAISSTNFLGNVMAGLMLRAYDNFQVGDFLRCEDHFGRVSERGLLHTELQTEDRDLTTLPNLYLATRPVKVVRSSGTVVSAVVSLGYDVSRKKVRELLLSAGEEAGLAEPFVEIAGLGDFTVEYRLGGLLLEVRSLFSTRSRLRGKMIDALHGGGVEIVSPTFMNTRRLDPGQPVMPFSEPVLDSAEGEAASGPEAVAFDKADLAVELERLQREKAGLLEERDELQGRREKVREEGARDALTDELSRIERRLERLERDVEERQGLLEDEAPRGGSRS